MWNEDYVVSVKHPSVKVDRYFITNIKELDNLEYEFIVQADTNLTKIEKYNTKEILINTYNLGKFIDEKFTIHIKTEQLDKIKHLNEKVRRNIFLKVIYETHLEFDCRRKSITQEVEKRLNINLKTDKNNQKLMESFNKELRKIEREIYLRKIDDQFKLNNISDKDYKQLLNLLNKWVATCGLEEKEIDLTKKHHNIFPIILLSHKIYLFIANEITNLEVKIIHSIYRDKDIYKTYLSVENINDLLYLLAMNYFRFNSYEYIICEICGKMCIGYKKKKTCSEKCKKIRNGSYYKK